MAEDYLSKLPADIQERIKKLSVVPGKQAVAAVVADASQAAGQDVADLQKKITELTEERDTAQAGLKDVLAKFETFSAESAKALDEAKKGLDAAKADLAAARAELPKKVSEGVSQGVKEGLASCAVPASQLPAPAAAASGPKTREELEKAMEAEEDGSKRLKMLAEFRAANASK